MGRNVMAVVGARPNYMKVAPIWRALDELSGIGKTLVHTGQHYDDNMSKVFFDDLKLPKPDVHLGVGSGPHGAQTGTVMIEIEKVLVNTPIDLLLVVGDVNSTMAGALVAAKMGVPVAHVEAGLRSFDRSMPEEINRMVTDSISDILFTTSHEAEPNLLREGVDAKKIHFVGNVMIDSLHFYRPMAEKSLILDNLGVEKKAYGLVTLHRPSNVDSIAGLKGILDALVEIGAKCPLLFPAHPRTRRMIEDNKLSIPQERLRMLEPIGYLDFVKLMVDSRIVLTDSGGIQEETTVLGIPCLTIRENTERPVTIEIGTNHLVGTDPSNVLSKAKEVLGQDAASSQIPELWDGAAAARIVRIIDEYLS